MCGKSTFVYNLLQNMDIFDTPVEDVVICYTEWQPMYEAIESKCRFIKGMIEPDDLDPSIHHLCIIDDMMNTGNENAEKIEQFFTRGCHHRNTSCIYITQNLFDIIDFDIHCLDFFV